MLTFAVLVALYFLPTILARNKHSFVAIFLLNLLLGWTVLGWFAALIWALAESECPQLVMPPPAGRYCCACGALTPHRQCPHCGRSWA